MSQTQYAKKLLLNAYACLPSGLKTGVYRLLGARIGKGVELGLGSYIVPFDSDFSTIRIGNGVVIGDGVHILAKKLILGDGTQIRDNTRIWGQSGFETGREAYIDRECHFDLRRDIILGDNVAVSGGSWFYTHMAHQSVLTGAPYTFGSITLGDRAYIGAGAFTLPGISIGSDAIVGARSVVTKNVEADTVVVGSPAREIDRTSHRKKDLTATEKELMVKDILEDFIRVYDRRTARIRDWDGMEFIFSFDGQPVYFRPKIEDVELVSGFIKPGTSSPTLISMGISGPVMDFCRNHSISWIDPGSGASSPKRTRAAATIGRFFFDYGVDVSGATHTES